MKDYLVDALMKCLNEDGLCSVEEITHKTIFLEQDMPVTFLLTAEDVAKYNMRKKYIEEAHLSSLQYMALANCKSALPKKIIKPRFPAIKKVYFNDPVTVVLWADGTKTIVRAENEEYDPEKGLAMAIAKKALGNEGNYYNVFKRFLITDEDLESIGEEPKSVADIITEMCGNLEKNVQKRLEGMKDDSN